MKPSTLLWTCAASSVLGASWIAPGAVWYDTDGNKIDAHGGGVVQRGDTFYWVGQAASNQTPMLYSSTDLINWKNLGKQASSITGMWRPKIAKPNGSYWLFGQQDRYVLSLKSSAFVGGYGQSAKVHIPPNDYSYSDTGMFYDEDADTYYLLTSADHNIVQVNKINSDGTLGSMVSDLRGGAYEAPGIVKADGVYYLIVSGKTGWRSNPNKAFWSTSINGPWQGGSDIAPQAQNTYGSQNTHELTVKGSQKTTHIYMGDAWDSKGGASSNYVWAPMNINSGSHSVQIDYHEMWKLDPKTGVVSYPTTKKRYEAEHAVLSGKTVVRDCSDCVSKRAVHGVSDTSDVTFQNVTGTGSRQWLSFHYRVNNPEAGEAHIFVNDEPAINISSLNSRAGYHTSTPIQLTLKRGDANTISFGATGSDGFEVAVDGIELFEDDDE
ncbi:carbohydrate-binding module family 35 protein [Hypoxylon fragiforme]|uniref:carbohydrate-binding module family 35 protein n=1 Tax=Hypoxylon fragiforme TaxID=63214 RepID=UPI0020C61812|nr:carbohydrate-binding module family 35 protein [Hypoxylon fragiforme]KAI2605071.1 carbohydrate-binding module family 35 protein [Hypoxylon fragiforme]